MGYRIEPIRVGRGQGLNLQGSIWAFFSRDRDVGA